MGQIHHGDGLAIREQVLEIEDPLDRFSIRGFENRSRGFISAIEFLPFFMK